MEKMVAYCGLVCTECPAYIATQADDRDALERVAAQWRMQYNVPDLTIEGVICDGCLGVSGRYCAHCAECEIRACGVEQSVLNCGHCTDYACEKLEGFFGLVPNARTLLDGIRATL